MKRFLIISIFFCSTYLAGGSVQLSPKLKQRIVNLVKSNPYQMKISEYTHLSKLILANPGSNILVFGVGRDSLLYADLNQSGRVVFLEDNPEWINIIKNRWPQLEIHKVTYNTLRPQWKSLLKPENREKLHLEIPAFIRKSNWDIIFVDAPAGNDSKVPGRMKSIYTAAQLACNSNGTHVLVHDVDRPVEHNYIMHFLKEENLQHRVRQLAHFYIPKGSSMVTH